MLGGARQRVEDDVEEGGLLAATAGGGSEREEGEGQDHNGHNLCGKKGRHTEGEEGCWILPPVVWLDHISELP